MLGEARCLELLDAALGACECDQAEAIIHSTNSSLTRFAESIIHQNVAESNAMVNVRAVLGKRVGCARGNQLAEDGVASVARRALDLSQVSAEEESFVSLPRPEPIPRVQSYAEATAASTPEQRAGAVRAIVEVAQRRAYRASGSLSAHAAEIAVANSLGVRAYAPVTEASLITVISDEECSGYAEWGGVDISRSRWPKRRPASACNPMARRAYPQATTRSSWSRWPWVT